MSKANDVKRAEEYFKKAVEDEEISGEERYELLKKALELLKERDDEKAWVLRARIYMELGKFEEALKAAEKVLELNSENVEAILIKITALEELDKLEEAEKEVKKSLEKHKDKRILRKLAEILAEERKYNESEEILEMLNEDFEDLKTKAKVLILENRLKAAEKILKKLAKKKKNRELLLLLIGLYKMKRDFKKALKFVEEALIKYPYYFQFWTLKGTILEDLGDYQGALECYNIALKHNSKDTVALYNKADLLQKMGKYESALRTLDKLLLIDPTDDDAWYLKADIYFKLKEFSKALECIDKAIELNPNDPSNWNFKGVILSEMKMDREAIKYYKKAIELNPNFYAAWLNLGLAYFDLKEWENAEFYLKKALELATDPADKYAIKMILKKHIPKAKKKK